MRSFLIARLNETKKKDNLFAKSWKKSLKSESGKIEIRSCAVSKKSRFVYISYRFSDSNFFSANQVTDAINQRS